jgi:hypothetical protein
MQTNRLPMTAAKPDLTAGGPLGFANPRFFELDPVTAHNGIDARAKHSYDQTLIRWSTRGPCPWGVTGHGSSDGPLQFDCLEGALAAGRRRDSRGGL